MWLFIILLACAIALLFFFFNDTATTEIYTLSLHDALLISNGCHGCDRIAHSAGRTGISTGMSTGLPASSTPGTVVSKTPSTRLDRKSTRLNSSHQIISYAVFCLKKKKTIPRPHSPIILYLE